MKIIFTDNIPDNNIPFAVYDYDEGLVNRNNYTNIKGIVNEKCWIWLDEIQNSHTRLSASFIQYSKWWWVTESSRLNVQAWGQGPIFKPLFFAKAILEWINNNQDKSELHLIGCNSLVKKYLLEFSNNLEIHGKYKNLYFHSIFNVILLFLKDSLAIIKSIYYLLKFHVLKKNNVLLSKIIIIYESVYGDNLKGRNYYYGKLFDSVLKLNKNKLFFVCTSLCTYRNNNYKDDIPTNNHDIYLLDYINIWDLIKSLFIIIYIAVIFAIIFVKRIPCHIGGSSSYLLWRNYLINQFSLNTCFINICCYLSLVKIIKISGHSKVIIQYEEKARERAIIMACQKFSTHVIGYMCHPMHRSLVALRDDSTLSSPKPDHYGVSGSSFVDYFSNWGNKLRDSLNVWGSGKHLHKIKIIQSMNRVNLKILVLISNPNEIKVFHSWLRNENELAQSIKYYVRYYKPMGNKVFEEKLNPLMNEYNIVKETNGTLIEDLELCDIVIFCSTSAGINAILHGYLCIYVELSDFFEINPCFDELNSLLPCKTSTELSNRLKVICKMDNDSLLKLHAYQMEMALKIFSPIRESVIEDELLDSKNS